MYLLRPSARRLVHCAGAPSIIAAVLPLLSQLLQEGVCLRSTPLGTEGPLLKRARPCSTACVELFICTYASALTDSSLGAAMPLSQAKVLSLANLQRCSAANLRLHGILCAIL